jgi:uncharacterized protein (TIGR02145 family)
VVNARLVSVQTGEVLQSVSRTTRAEVDAIVTDLLPQLAQDLSGRTSGPVVVAPVTSASITVDANHFMDARDSQIYKFVKIGTQAWMAQNLNYAGITEGVGVCYGNLSSNCMKYGRLYTWSEVMAGAASSTSVPSGVQGICPSGWHVPSDAEWNILVRYVDSATSGTKLKSTSGWTNSGNGTDTYSFTVLPAGDRYRDGTFGSLDYYTYFWSSSEDDAAHAWARYFLFNLVNTYRLNRNESNSFSLRCLQNN